MSVPAGLFIKFKNEHLHNPPKYPNKTVTHMRVKTFIQALRANRGNHLIRISAHINYYDHL
jgi:hypothetical protein